MTKPMRAELVDMGGWLPKRPSIVGEIVIQKDDDGRVSQMLSGSSNALPFRVWTPFSKSLRGTVGPQPAERVMELTVGPAIDGVVEVILLEKGKNQRTIAFDPSDRANQKVLFTELQRFAKKLGGDFDF